MKINRIYRWEDNDGNVGNWEDSKNSSIGDAISKALKCNSKMKISFDSNCLNSFSCGSSHYNIVIKDAPANLQCCIDWLTGEDGYDGGICGLYDFIWYEDIPGLTGKDAYWYEPFNSEWDSFVPNQKDWNEEHYDVSLFKSAWELYELLSKKADEINARLKARYDEIVANQSKKTHEVHLYARAEFIAHVHADNVDDAVKTAKGLAISSAGNVGGGWSFGDGIVCDKDERLIEVDHVYDNV